MSKREKLLRRLALAPKDFTWSELVTLLTSFNLELIAASGSARKFRNPVSGRHFNIHEPHPSNILKPYQVRAANSFLKQEGFLK